MKLKVEKLNQSRWNNEKWFVSHFNYLREVRHGQKLPHRVSFHDTTLRDGEQQAGIIFRKKEKIQIARLLDEVGVSRIEAGMPAVSREDKAAVKAIAHEGLNAKIFSFARCMKRDVDLALDCDVDGLVMEIPSSDHLIKYGYGWTVDEAIRLSVEATRYASEHGLQVAFFTIDSTRSKLNTFLGMVNKVASEGHMDSYVLVDTFGVCLPGAMRYLVDQIKKEMDKPIEVHCHNDFGLAVANSLAAVERGVEIVHTTVNGIGERSGGAALEEVAAALEVLYGIETGIDLARLRKLSKLVEKTSLIRMPPQKPVVGDNTFVTESGIIAGWWNKAKNTKPLEVFPIRPDLLGGEEIQIALGKKSGRDSIIYKIEELGQKTPSDEKIGKILEKVKTTSERKKRVLTNEEFIAIIKSIG